jgi:hypothetical protein
MGNKYIFLIFPYSVAHTAPQGLFFTGGVQQYLFPAEPFENPFPGDRLGVGWDFPLSAHGFFALGLVAARS